MQNHYTQKPGIDKILKEAFSYWNRTFIYQIVFSLVFLSVSFLVFYHFSSKLGILEQFIDILYKNRSQPELMQKALQKMFQTPQYRHLYWIMLATTVLLYPLNLGLFKIFRKLDLGEKIESIDLFSGYSGVNFFIYTSYYLFWTMVFAYTMPTRIFGIIWILVTLFSAPLMFFMDKRVLETIELNFKALKIYFVEITVCVLVAFLFKYAGLIFFGGGFLLTFPFYNAMIYALYRNIFAENQK